MAAVLGGCTVKQINPEGRLEKRQLTIQAVPEEQDDPETRTMRNDKGKVYWCKGDRISLFYGKGTDGGSVFTSTQEEDTVKVTNFTGTIGVITGGADITEEDTYFWGLYPYNESASCDGSSITTTLSPTQTAFAGSYATGTQISLGRSQGLIMGFYNVTGGFRFTVNKEGVRKATFRGNNGEKLAGTLKVSFVSGKPSTEVVDGVEEIVLEAPVGEYFEVGKYYYFVMAPAAFANGFTVKAETYTEETTFEYSKSVTVAPSGFMSKTNMDKDLTWTQKTGNIPVEDANFKAYLVENFDTDKDGEVSYAEAAAITTIRTYMDGIESVQGIEYMQNLDTLCHFGSKPAGLLTKLDVSNNTELVTLYCYSNQLMSLDVSKNTALTSLDCSPMAVNDNNVLETLYIYDGQTINWITENRNGNYIPAATEIVVRAESGGNDDNKDTEL